MAKKLSTAEILAAARAEAAKQKGEAAPEPAESHEAPAAPEKPAAAAAQRPAAGTPKSTADILAAARAQDKGATSAVAKPAASAPQKPAAGAPKSTTDILAAARAQAKGEAPPAAEKPAADKSAPAKKGSAKPAATPSSSGPKPSVQEMLKAVREGKPAEPAEAAKPAAPKIPVKPAPAAKKPAAESRRNALLALVATPFAAAWTALTATSLAALLGTARFMFPNVLVEPPMRFKIGPPSEYPPGTVSTKWIPSRGIWVVHTDQYKGQDLIYALISVCTHLGCTPNWLDGEQKFKCPCHGSGFYITGVNFEGPAPRPLERAGISLAPDGMLEVDKSRKFQEELGQWEDATSFVDASIA